MKFINSKAHGVLDYLTVIFLVLSPTLFHMSGVLETFTYGLAVVHLLLTICTRFELGIIKVLPFKVHGIIEVCVAVLLTGVALWFNDAGNFLGFYFYLWLALVIMVVFLCTNFTAPVQRLAP